MSNSWNRGSGSLQWAVAPSGSGGLYGPPFCPSTLFFAPSAVSGATRVTADFTAQGTRWTDTRPGAPSDQVEPKFRVRQKAETSSGSGGLYGPPYCPSTLFFAPSAVAGRSRQTTEFSAQKTPEAGNRPVVSERFEEPHI